MKKMFLAFAFVSLGCGSPAQQAGVGRECAANEDCGENQQCLSFKGGYCGLEDCDTDADCPSGSACVIQDDDERYCFLLCGDKPECNAGRSADAESNCSANVEFAEGQDEGVKACVPPSA